MPAGDAGRLPLAGPLLRLRSDEQLLAAFRAGSDAAFATLHDRYRQRLFAYVRQMLSAASRQDAEDVLQDVFVRAYGTLRADGREMNVKAWLYRVAHNRCIDHLRRPVPPAAEILDVSRSPLHDPMEEAQRREDLARLVHDIARLPEQQRSALLMREIDGLSYQDLAAALDVTVPAIKSLLVRARVGLVEAAEARDADCEEIRRSLLDAYDRGVKASGHARRHLRTCEACTEYRAALRGVRRSFAALTPVGFGPLALVAKVLGISGAGGGSASALAGGGAAAGGTTAAGGSAAAGALAGGSAIAGVTACKVAAVVCSAAIAGGAVEAHHAARTHQAPAPVHAAAVPATATKAPVPRAAPPTPPPHPAAADERADRDAAAPRAEDRKPATDRPEAATPVVLEPLPAEPQMPATEDVAPVPDPVAADPVTDATDDAAAVPPAVPSTTTPATPGTAGTETAPATTTPATTTQTEAGATATSTTTSAAPAATPTPAPAPVAPATPRTAPPAARTPAPAR